MLELAGKDFYRWKRSDKDWFSKRERERERKREKERERGRKREGEGERVWVERETKNKIERLWER